MLGSLLLSSSLSRGLVVAVLASLAFASSGAFVKPLMEGGWSTAAAVTVRATMAGLMLLPLALWSLRGRWDAVWRGRWRIAGMGLLGVAATQLLYFSAMERVPVSTALLMQYLAPLLLVGLVWMTTRRRPAAIVLVGCAVAVGGLVLVIGPGSLAGGDPVGLLFAAASAIGCAGYFVVAARPSDGLPPLAFASFGLLLGGLGLAVLGATGVIDLRAQFGDVPFLGSTAPWWVPVGIVALVATAVAYAAGITAAGMLGSRLASFVSLLEVVFAAGFAWMLLGESLAPVQLGGGALLLAGIVLVRLEKQAPIEPPVVTTPILVPVHLAAPSDPLPDVALSPGLDTHPAPLAVPAPTGMYLDTAPAVGVRFSSTSTATIPVVSVAGAVAVTTASMPVMRLTGTADVETAPPAP